MLGLFGLRLWKILKCLSNKKYLHALLRFRVLAAVEHQHLFQQTSWATVLDIGANRGQFSLVAQAESSAQIIAFEPLNGPADQFARIFACSNAVRLHRCAIGGQLGEAVMNVSARDDSSSLLPIGFAQTRLFRNTQRIGVQTVPLKTLMSLVGEKLPRPALMKMDVQGYEYSILSSSMEVLEGIDCIYCECSFIELYDGQKLAQDVIALLAKIGFSLSGVYNASYDGRGQAIQADFLFLRRAPNGDV